jgi:hypothetical protein
MARAMPGFPIRPSRDQALVCSSPELIAAYHGLHRLCVPRHPPHAFARLTHFSVKQSTRDLNTNETTPFSRIASCDEIQSTHRKRPDDASLSHDLLHFRCQTAGPIPVRASGHIRKSNFERWAYGAGDLRELFPPAPRRLAYSRSPLRR